MAGSVQTNICGEINTIYGASDISSYAVTTAKLATSAVTANELGALAVTTAKINTNAVTVGKMLFTNLVQSLVYTVTTTVTHSLGTAPSAVVCQAVTTGGAWAVITGTPGATIATVLSGAVNTATFNLYFWA